MLNYKIRESKYEEKGDYVTSKRLLEAEDLYKIQSITNPRISPDGESAIFIRTQMDQEENKYYSHLFHIKISTGKVLQWTFGKEKIINPQWSPDGKQVAFISNRDEKNRLYIMNKDGGEPKKITTFDSEVESFLWSPCGEKIWITSRITEDEDFFEKDIKEQKNPPKPYVVDQMKYKMDGIGGEGLVKQGVYSQIAMISLRDQSVTQFSQGNYSHKIMDISSDGKKLIIGVNREENQDFNFSEPIYLVDVETKEEMVIVNQEGYFGGAKFSPDDCYVAYVGSDDSYKNATQANLYIFDTLTNITQNLTEGIDSPVGDYAVADIQQGVNAPSICWTETNDYYFRLSSMGDVRLYYGTLDGAIYPASPEEEHVYDYDVSKDGLFALVCVSNPTSPGELYHYEITTGNRKKLTHFHDDFHNEVELATPTPISYKSVDGLDVHGWMMKPIRLEEGKKYPLIVEIHGGPHTMYSNTFFHELQLLAALGYGVLYVNPRGSHGYSQSFVNAVRGDYGGGDYEDIISGLDFAIQENSWIDERRLGVTGSSYGGFMTNWIVGHTNRFKAAVTQRSISNWISFFGVSDIGYYFTDWQLGTDMMNPEKLWDHSPLKYAKNIETPLLILHSEKDFRCPIEQAEQLFMTLKTMKKETSFVRFPENNHNLSRTGTPNLRIERLRQIVSWFEKYL
ncbi:S9 family peptidase [Ureibacillus composti]|nr:S9 family peptidase [Ureibacillus composti]